MNLELLGNFRHIYVLNILFWIGFLIKSYFCLESFGQNYPEVYIAFFRYVQIIIITFIFLIGSYL